MNCTLHAVTTSPPEPREALKMDIVGQTTLGGHGDCMHVSLHGDVAYVAHMGGDRVGTSVVDISDPTEPRLIRQLMTPPGTHSHKVETLDGLMLVNHERNPSEKADSWSAGLAIYDISDPSDPRELGFFPVGGKGVHRMTYMDPPYVYLSAGAEGFVDQFLVIVDLSDPENPGEAGRWWLPGMNEGAGEQRTWPEELRYAHHHALIRGDRAYATWWDAGLVILDVADVSNPVAVSHLQFGTDVSRCTHTALPLPGRDLLVVTDESTSPNCNEVPKRIRVVDISDEANPRVVSTFPVPEGDFCQRGGRFGPHNLHEMRTGTFTSSNVVHVTYFNAGVRVYDVSDPADVREIAFCIPPPAPGAKTIQMNDLMVSASGLVFATDRVAGGLYVLSCDVEQ
jgi:hypothetical protein